ncbi:MAG: serine/threonine-protein kinase [Patulibacter minatonensis]
MTRHDAHRLGPGDVLDDFLVEDVLAQGGSTTTFRAASQALERTVSLKYFHPETFLQDGATVEEARQSASAVARLEHPGITPVFAAGEWGGGMYVASAMPSGPTLEEQIEGDGVSVSATVQLVGELARALEHAHGSSIIHRDLRPGCVIVGRWGHALLRDFGVTRASGRTGLLTRAEVMDSLRYTAPEIILGRAPTALTDTYGLAAIAVACLTGSAPYPDDAPGRYVVMRTSAPPPRLGLADGREAPAVADVFVRALALDPAARPTPTEFATALANAVQPLPADVKNAHAPFVARPERAGEVTVAGTVAPAEAPPTAPAPVPEPPRPVSGDVTRIEQRRPVMAGTAAERVKVRWTVWASVATGALTAGAIAAAVAVATAPGPAAPLKIGDFKVTPTEGWVPDPGGAPTLRAPGGATAALAVAPPRLPGDPLPDELVGRVSPVLASAGGRDVVVYDDGEEILVAAPSVRGALYARCSQPTGTERCAALLVSDVSGPRPVPVTPDPRAAGALRTALGSIQQEGGVALAEMTAKESDGRAAGADQLAGVLRNAAGTLTVEGVDAGTAAGLGQVAKALAAEAGALQQLSSAIDRKSKTGQDQARRAATDADARMRTALDRFRVAGYPVEG